MASKNKNLLLILVLILLFLCLCSPKIQKQIIQEKIPLPPTEGITAEGSSIIYGGGGG